jgi:membrane-bound lytic murein transglycosylase B
LLVTLLPLPVMAQAETQDTAPKPSVSQWLSDLRTEAVAQGLSESVFDSALADFTPIERVVELDKKQPETKITLEEYLQKTITPARVKNGRQLLAENRELLGEIAKKYDVPASVIVALWGMETSYGKNTGNFKIAPALATLAYDGRRSSFFRDELIKALFIMQAEQLSNDDFYGSWAGAFGQCQFMPTSFLNYAVDYDGDGKRDIWNTEADVFASIANYIHSEGWQNGEPIAEGNNNFAVIMKWNRSRYFATAVKKLSEKFDEQDAQKEPQKEGAKE